MALALARFAPTVQALLSALVRPGESSVIQTIKHQESIQACWMLLVKGITTVHISNRGKPAPLDKSTAAHADDTACRRFISHVQVIHGDCIAVVVRPACSLPGVPVDHQGFGCWALSPCQGQAMLLAGATDSTSCHDSTDMHQMQHSKGMTSANRGMLTAVLQACSSGTILHQSS